MTVSFVVVVVGVVVFCVFCALNAVKVQEHNRDVDQRWED